MKRAFVFLCVFYLCIRFAESKVPELRVVSAEKPYSLKLTELSISTTIRGYLAKSEFILTYKNNEDQDLRAEFLFPLPDDAVLTDIGLYFGDKLRHSVVVERNQGRRAFEEIVHRRVDPALAEWMSGNTFRLDVYPVPAHNVKKVYVSYQQELRNQNDAWKYQLDLNYKIRLTRFQLNIQADKNFVLQSNLPVSNTTGNWKLDKQNFLLETQVVMTSTRTSALALVEPDEEKGLYYVSLPVKTDPNSVKIEKAFEVILFWDSSGSSVHENAEELFAFLKPFIQAQKKEVSIRVIPFHQEVEPEFTISNAGSDAGFQKLKEYLATLPPIGATDLVRVFRSIGSTIRSAAADSRIILVTDGLGSLHSTATLGEAVRNLAPLGKPVLVLSASDQIDSHLLNQIAEKTGGWFLNLRNSNKQISKQVDKVMHAPVTVSVYSSSSNFTEIYQFQDEETLRIAAKSRNVLGTGTLTLKLTGVSKDAYKEITFDYRMLNDCRGMIRTTWAASRLRQLMQTPGNHNQEYLEIGKNYHLLTPRTSFIVLETWQDYQLYGITMPPDVLQEYQRAINPPAKSGRLPGTQPGSLFGRITDDKGGPLPGVSVTLQSNQAMRMTSTTGPGGTFQFTRIPPGDYSVTASIEGFTTIRQESVRLIAGGAVQLDLKLNPALAEEFVVVAETPMIDSKKTGNSSTFNREYFDRVPSARDPWVFNEQRPGIDSDRIQVAGSESGQTGFFARGGDSAGNSWNYDALKLPTYYDFDAYEEIGRQTNSVDKDLFDKVLAKLASPGLSNEQKCKIYVAGRLLFQNFPEYYIRASKLFEGELALRILFETLEFGSPDSGMLRAIARNLMFSGKYDSAQSLLLKIIELASSEPHTWRDLGLLYAKRGMRVQAEEAYRKLLTSEIDPRHSGINPLATEELQRLLKASPTAKTIDLECDPAYDLKILLQWDSNYTDVDLHVVEPSGEEVSYDHRDSAAKGHLSDDITSGYGPEMYTIRRAPSGIYEVYLNYYAGDQTSVLQSSTAVVSVFQRNAEGKIVRTDHSILLSTAGENVPVTSIVIR